MDPGMKSWEYMQYTVALQASLPASEMCFVGTHRGLAEVGQ